MSDYGMLRNTVEQVRNTVGRMWVFFGIAFTALVAYIVGHVASGEWHEAFSSMLPLMVSSALILAVAYSAYYAGRKVER